MMASVGHPVLRLVRHQIGPWKLDDLQSGESRMIKVNLPAAAKKPNIRRKQGSAKFKKKAKL